MLRCCSRRRGFGSYRCRLNGRKGGEERGLENTLMTCSDLCGSDCDFGAMFKCLSLEAMRILRFPCILRAGHRTLRTLLWNLNTQFVHFLHFLHLHSVFPMIHEKMLVQALIC